MSAGDSCDAGTMRICAALCQYEMAGPLQRRDRLLSDALALPERLLALRRRRPAAHLAPQVVDAEQTGETGEAAEVGRRPEARDEAAHQHRAQRGADAVESE